MAVEDLTQINTSKAIVLYIFFYSVLLVSKIFCKNLVKVFTFTQQEKMKPTVPI